MIGPASPADRRGRLAAALLFGLNGVIGFALLPRLAEIQVRVGVDDAGLGIILAVGTAGGVVVGPLAGFLVPRWGATPVAVVAGLLMAPALIGIGLAAVPWAVALALAILLGADAVMDSAMNTRALQIQRSYGRSIINSFHAWWSYATVLGAALGAGSAAIGISLPVFTALLAVAVAAALAGVGLLDRAGPAAHVPLDSGSGAAVGSRSSLRIFLTGGGILLAVFIVGAVVIEAIPSLWSSVYLTDLGAASIALGVGYVLLTGGQALGRTFADRVVDRVGEARVVRVSLVVSAITFGGALLIGGVLPYLIACAVCGLGAAALFPAAIHAASRLPAVRPEMGVALVSWFSRAGFVFAPLAVGFIAEGIGLRAGMAVFVAGAAIALAASGVLVGASSSHRDGAR